jgi:hypothetical protein
MEKECPVCHKVFKIRPCTFDRRVCCSRKCYGEYKKLFPKKYNFFKKGHKGYKSSYWLGKKRPDKTKQNMSKSHKNNPKVIKHIKELAAKHSGKNHWNWKGGITDEMHLLRGTEEYQIWRNKVYAHDNWTCQYPKCGKKLKDLIAHHKKSFKEFPELRFVVSNGITYCRPHHKKIHEEIGKSTQFKSKNGKQHK